MKQRFLFLLSFYIPSLLFAQSESATNIEWSTELSWQLVRKKANETNKKIFVFVCETTSGACNAMMKEVYSDKRVAQFINEHFLPLSIQVGQSKEDNELTKQWYSEAQAFRRTYKVLALPTFLFFNSDGEIQSQVSGFKSTEEFLKLLQDVIVKKAKYKNAFKAYDNLVARYRKGEVKCKKLPEMINTCRSILDKKELLDSLVKDYYTCLDRMPQKKYFNKENLNFLSKAVENSSNKYFSFIVKNANKIDSIMMNMYFTRKIIDDIIIKEDINAFFKARKKGEDPDWNVLSDSIAKKYDVSYAERNTLTAKITWFRFKKQTSEEEKYYLQLIDKNGIDTTENSGDHILNSVAFRLIFNSCNDREHLVKATNWMKDVVERSERRKNPYRHLFIDTYASLLYKLGEKLQAIEWEEIAVSAARLVKEEYFVNSYTERIKLMEHGKPTWYYQ